MRSICRADKLWVEAGVGMSKANDLASWNPKPPSGGAAVTVCYAQYFCISMLFFP